MRVHHQQGLVIAQRLQGVAEFDCNVGIDEPPALDALACGSLASLGLGDDGDVGHEDGGLVNLVQDGTGEIRAAGQALAVIEAMKMENELVAPLDGVVVELGAAAPSAIEKGALLARIEPK